jgi:hypothetical protein
LRHGVFAVKDRTLYKHSTLSLFQWNEINFRGPMFAFLKVKIRMLRLSLSAVLLLIYGYSFSQVTVRGKLLSQPDNKPVPFANIGIINKNVGTISNEDGTFSIRIPDELKNDTLIFSALGYEKRILPVADLSPSKEHVLYLIEKAIELQAVTVTGRKEKAKTFELGNRYFRGGFLLADSVYAGASMALLIRNAYPSFHEDLVYPVYLKSARVRIFKSNVQSFRFRVRLYEKDSLTGKPGKDFLHQSVIMESDMRKGWLEFDLSKLNLKIEKDFFIAFEWILDDRDRLGVIKAFHDFRKQYPHRITRDSVLLDGQKVVDEHLNWQDFPGTALSVSPIQFSRDNYICYTQENSFGEWKRCNAILTVRVEVSTQPFSESKNETVPRSELKDLD